MIDLEPLVKMGLPWGPPVVREPGDISLSEVRETIRRLAEAPELPAPEVHEPLLAWLAGFRHHWRETWKSEIGPCGDRLLERLAAEHHDANRYLELRRIAIATLSQIV